MNCGLSATRQTGPKRGSVLVPPGSCTYIATPQMIAKLRQMLGRTSRTNAPAIPEGERVYAVGDIHGRADLFEDIVGLIEADDAARGPANTTVVLLGDLVDRGPASAGVVSQAREWAKSRPVEFIQGNHEEMLLAARHNQEALRGFLRFGGYETILSYGIDPEELAVADLDEAQSLLNAAIPQEDIDFIESFGKMVRIGDYVFVHAGVRPEVPLEHQQAWDCRWIREPFLSHRGDFGGFVVHGHTITEEPDIRGNRAGIDTGAFLHGTLTAIGLEGTDRWFLQAREADEGTLSSGD